MQELIAVDLETTGFDPETDRIIEIGAVRVRLTADGVEAGERFSTFVDPGRDIGTVITRLTGIRDGDLIGAPTAADAVARFAAFAGDAVFVGHNVGFDLAFLEQNGFAPGAQRLDTADPSRRSRRAHGPCRHRCSKRPARTPPSSAPRPNGSSPTRPLTRCATGGHR